MGKQRKRGHKSTAGDAENAEKNLSFRTRREVWIFPVRFVRCSSSPENITLHLSQKSLFGAGRGFQQLTWSQQRFAMIPSIRLSVPTFFVATFLCRIIRCPLRALCGASTTSPPPYLPYNHAPCRYIYTSPAA